MFEKFTHHLIKSLAVTALLLSVGCSTFQMTSSPTADIYENGEKVGRTPYSFNLMSGARTFTLKKFGYVEEEITVTSLDSKKMHFDLQWVGKTRVTTTPPGAEVIRIEDGELLGETPCGLHLARGERVALKLKGYETIERDLVPNETYSIQLKSDAGFKTAFYRDILFSSSQGSVEIYDRVAGERIGTTPVRLNVEAGAALEYRLNGHEPKFDLISRNAPHRINIELQPKIHVTLMGPRGAEVYRAGGVEKLGVLPLLVEVDGNSLYEIKMDGFYDRSVAVAPDSPSRLKIQLKEIPYKMIKTDPPGADVYRLGGLEKLGTAPFKVKVEGERVFEIKKKGYRPSVIGVGPSSPSSLSVPLTPIPRDDPDAAAIGSLDSDVVDQF